MTPHIKKKNALIEQAMLPRERFSVTPLYVATRNSLQGMSYSSRIAVNTISKIIHEILEAIITVLEKKVMIFPSTVEECQFFAHRFELI